VTWLGYPTAHTDSASRRYLLYLSVTNILAQEMDIKMELAVGGENKGSVESHNTEDTERVSSGTPYDNFTGCAGI